MNRDAPAVKLSNGATRQCPAPAPPGAHADTNPERPRETPRERVFCGIQPILYCKTQHSRLRGVRAPVEARALFYYYLLLKQLQLSQTSMRAQRALGWIFDPGARAV